MAHHLVAPLGGGVQPRLEINTFVQNDRFFSLYVQALSAPLSHVSPSTQPLHLSIAAMQNVDQSDLLSWFQIAGIHGYPYISYDGANGVNGFHANPALQAAGYCTHGSTLFPTWHRPLTMLVEVSSSLLSHVLVITFFFFFFLFFSSKSSINMHDKLPQRTLLLTKHNG